MQIIGMDVGGTNIKAGLVRNDRIIKRIHLPTIADGGLETSLRQIRYAISKLLSSQYKEILAIGIGIAGIIDSKNGIVRYSPNLKEWKDIELVRVLKKEFKIPIKILNDVNAILLGEWKYGAGKNYRNIFLFTLGTGVGGAAVCEGKLLFGANGFAGEFGHTTIKCDGMRCVCGNFGCLEKYVGTRAIFELTLKKMAKGKSKLKKYSELTPKIIADEAKNGDPIAREIFAEIGEHIGTGLSNIINLLDPEVIIISGGISRAGRILFEPIKMAIQKRILGASYRKFRIVPSRLRDDAGILGSAYFAAGVI